MNGKKTVGLILNIILTAIGLAGACGAFGDNEGSELVNCIAIAMYLMIIYYIFFGYNVPHGNLFKWLVLIFSFALSFSMPLVVLASNQSFPNFNSIILILAIVLSAFLAGRLNRFKQNVAFMIIISAILIYTSIMTVVSGGITYWATIILAFGPVIMWADIIIAYVTKYSDHKEAGKDF